jgi:magnesium transporter
MLLALNSSTDLAKLVRGGDVRRLARVLARTDDVQVAAQVDNLEPAEQDAVFQHLPGERRPKVLSHMRYEVAAQIIGRLAPEEAAGLLDNIESDDAADILGRIDESKLRATVALGPERTELMSAAAEVTSQRWDRAAETLASYFRLAIYQSFG